MKNIAVKMETLISASLLTVALIHMPSSWAHEDCSPYTASFILQGPTPFGPLNGEGIYNIGDLPPQPAQISAVLKGSASFDPASSVNEVSYSDMVIFAPGADGALNVLTAVDNAVSTATGPGVFEGKARSRITGGVGLYENVTGMARSTNTTTVDLATGYTVSEISVEGKICGIANGG